MRFRAPVNGPTGFSFDHVIKFIFITLIIGLNFGLIRDVVKPAEPAAPTTPPEMSDQARADALQALGVTPHFHPIFAPGTPPEVIEAFLKRFPEHAGRPINQNGFTFPDNNRWSTTATNGGGLSQGDPTTLTWGFIPDGTSMFGHIGEPTAPSNLIARLDGIYGAGPGGADLTQRPWFPLFVSIFDRWAELTNVSYIYEPNDDGAAFGQFSMPNGQLGIRADIRIGGHNIDGTNNTLAYNFFPNTGDMVIDTNDNFYNDTANNSLKLRNVLGHEHGHGLGIEHVCPVNQTKLMEPFATVAFDGPQLDDILAANRGYGDSLEPNDSSGTAHSLGLLSNGLTSLNTVVSIDDNDDTDYYSFTVTEAKAVLIEVAPLGETYLSGPQNFNGSCTAGSNFNALAQNNLALELRDTNGVTVLASASATGLGDSETISGFNLPGPGTYFVRVSGPQNAAQLYELDLIVGNVVAPNLQITKSVTPPVASPGAAVAYTLSYANIGLSLATEVVITDLLPSAITNVVVTSSGPAITATGGSDFVWEVADLAPSESGTITLTGVISPGLTENVTVLNEATIAGSGDQDGSNNSASAALTVKIPGPNVTLTKSVTPLEVSPGQPLIYTLTYSNVGTTLASGVVITDILPLSLTQVISLSSGAALNPISGTTYAWQVADLAPDAGGTITLTGLYSGSFTTGTIITNTATITAGGDVSTVNNVSSAPVLITLFQSPGANPIYLPLIIK